MTHSGDHPKYLHRISHQRIDPPALTGTVAVQQLIDQAFLSYNAGRLREACRLFSSKMLADDTTVGLSLSGALTPAGLGMSCLVPLVEAGFIDWIVSTGANLYHDTHFALGMELHQSRPGLRLQYFRVGPVLGHHRPQIGIGRCGRRFAGRTTGTRTPSRSPAPRLGSKRPVRRRGR